MAEAGRDAPGALDRSWTLRDGTRATIRAMCAADAPALAAFHRALSERSLFLRYFSVSRADLDLGGPASDSALSLVAETRDGDGFAIVGLGALVPTGDGRAGEMAVLVADAYQRRGLGGELLRRLIALARQRRMKSIAGEMLPENASMIALARRLGFTVASAPDDARIIRATLALSDSHADGPSRD